MHAELLLLLRYNLLAVYSELKTLSDVHRDHVGHRVAGSLYRLSHCPSAVLRVPTTRQHLAYAASQPARWPITLRSLNTAKRSQYLQSTTPDL